MSPPIQPMMLSIRQPFPPSFVRLKLTLTVLIGATMLARTSATVPLIVVLTMLYELNGP